MFLSSDLKGNKMSYASWVVRRSMRGLEVLEVHAEKDAMKCQKKIDRLVDRIEVDRAYVDFARDTRVVMTQYCTDVSDIEMDHDERILKAGTRMVENLPAKPKTKGIFHRRLVVPVQPATIHATVSF